MHQMYIFSSNFVLIMYHVLFFVLSGFIICSHADMQTHDIYPEATCQTSQNYCLTLPDVLNERDKYFTSNSTLVFHEGQHILPVELLFVSNISNFTLQGYNGYSRSSPTITCVNFNNFKLQDYGGSGSGSGLQLRGSGSGLAIPCVSSSLSFSDMSIAITSIDFDHCSISLSHAAAVVHRSRFENGCAVDGGAITVLYSNVQFEGANIFAGNLAERYGGALYVHQSTLTFSGRTVFIENKARTGGAVYCRKDTSLSFIGKSIFMKNMAEWLGEEPHRLIGGAVYAWYNNTFSFIGNTSFISNTAVIGGAVSAWDNNTLRFNGNNIFLSNTAVVGGGVSAWDNNTLSFNGNISLISNTAVLSGGGVHADYGNTLSFNGNSSFMNNTSDYEGGAVFTWNSNTLSFNGSSSFLTNTAGLHGGAVSASVHNTMNFNGSSSFKSNMVDGDGGAVYLKNSSLSFHGSSIFVSNEAARGGGIALFLNSHLHLLGKAFLLLNTASFGGGAFVQDSSIDCPDNIEVLGNKAVHGGGLFVQSSEITFQDNGSLAGNTATNPVGGYGGAIIALSSIIKFQGSFDVTENAADFGGGLALFGVYDGVLIVKDYTILSFEGNLAYRHGGAIFVEDDRFSFCAFDNATQNHIDRACFFQTTEGPYNCFNIHDSDYQHQANSITLKFDSNIANVSGDIMYGGHLESCVACSAYSLVTDRAYTLGAETFRYYAESKVDVFSKLSSDPYKVCLCENSHPNCDVREVNRTVYPGQVLVTSVVAVGQMSGIVPSVIRAVSDNLNNAPNFQETQPAENTKECSQLQYPLFLGVPSTSLKLYSDEPCSTSGYPLTFLINFLPCPVGFMLSGQGGCICAERLQKYTQNCRIENLTISRDAGDSFWVGVESTDKLILHPHCPLDYCTEEPAQFLLNSTDMQCANGRSGILCGACQPRLGLALGSSRCLSECSNTFLVLLLAFAFAGVALVAFLFLCHFTVAEGTLSGLIFYANVVAVNRTVFFPSGEQNLLTVFIAWLNLDLGIETCFFVTLDAYYRTWLQFVFPIYIWVMVGVIIVLADRSTAFAKIIGSTNPVAVLATLFLLSYTKLLRAIMAAFSFTPLDYPDGNNVYVWLYDGNVGYLDGRHIGLFTFSLLFLLFVFLPYTVFLLCGQCIQKQLWWLPSTWQLYLKFFLDAHYGPYKTRHSYWTGLLLLLRFLMLFVVTIININNPQDPHSNLLVTQVVTTGMIAWGWFVRGFYKHWYHDMLEGSFIFNLVVLAGGTYQVRQSGGSQTVLVYASVSIAFTTFVGIVFNALMSHVKGELPDHLRTAIHNRFTRNDQIQDYPVQTAVPVATVTYSVVEIDHQESGNAEGETEPSTSASTGQ